MNKIRRSTLSSIFKFSSARLTQVKWVETQSLYNINFPAERARKLLVFDTFLPLPLRPGRQRWPDLLLPTFLQLHSPLSARLAACGSLLSLLPPLQAPPAQSNGGSSKYQQKWIEERESVFQLMNLDYFIFLYFPSTDCLTSSLWHGIVYLAWCRWTVDTPPGGGQVMSGQCLPGSWYSVWPVLVSAPVMSAAALISHYTGLHHHNQANSEKKRWRIWVKRTGLPSTDDFSYCLHYYTEPWVNQWGGELCM